MKVLHNYIVIIIILHLLFKSFEVNENDDNYSKSKRSLSIDELIYIRELFIYNYSIISRKNNYYKVLFFIESSTNHVNKRKRIIKTWINICLKISCNYYFVIATKGKIEEIEKENKNDIIGVDILNSYYNLTILTSNIYKYYITFNLYSDYIIKIDDDIYPNIPIIVIYISVYINKLKISGYYYNKMKVSRNRNSSVYLPKSIYPYKIFPNFLAGGFVITHSNLIFKLYKEILKEKRIIYREDMHMAVIYEKLNIKFQKLNYYYHRKERNITFKIKLNDICWHGF